MPNAIFKTATTLCPTAPQNGSTSANPHPCTHQTTPRMTPCPTPPPQTNPQNLRTLTLYLKYVITPIAKAIWEKTEQDLTNRQLGQPPFRSCISSRFAGAIKYTGLRARSVFAVGDFLAVMIHDQGLCSLVSGQTNEFLGVNHTRVHVNVEGWTVGGVAGFHWYISGASC